MSQRTRGTEIVPGTTASTNVSRSMRRPGCPNKMPQAGDQATALETGKAKAKCRQGSVFCEGSLPGLQVAALEPGPHTAERERGQGREGEPSGVPSYTDPNSSLRIRAPPSDLV